MYKETGVAFFINISIKEFYFVEKNHVFALASLELIYFPSKVTWANICSRYGKVSRDPIYDIKK